MYFEDKIADFVKQDILLSGADVNNDQLGVEEKCCSHCKWGEGHGMTYTPLCLRFHNVVTGHFTHAVIARGREHLCGISGRYYEDSEAWKEAKAAAENTNKEK